MRVQIRSLAAAVAVVSLLLSLIMTAGIGQAVSPQPGPFERTWARTDKPVADGQASRTWIWGQDAFTEPVTERYADAPGGTRTVQYFDKSRMEDNAYRGSAPWDVTNGLLVVELMTGEMQVGDTQFESRAPAEINVAGDPGDPLTYAVLGRLRDSAPLQVGASITQRLDASGQITNDPDLVQHGVIAVGLVPETNHTVASPFWEFMTDSGLVYENGGTTIAPLFEDPYYATGYPITEAYWANVTVGGTQRDVLLQCFQRRCLTYTPDNPEGWQVEMGNVGRHYYSWRYERPGTGGETATVTRVVDGDTIDVMIDGREYRVRYIGIDTPEVYGGVDCYGPEASAANRNLVEGQTVRLEKDVSETDRYGRLLRYVWVGDTFVNDWLVRNGYAYASTYPPDVKYSEQFAAAQQEAMANGRGLWAGCEVESTATATPTATPTQPPAPTATATQPPAPTATATTPPQQNCHPSYPDHCIAPPPPDLNCPDIPNAWKPLRVLHSVPNPDPHRLDGDKDGWACER